MKTLTIIIAGILVSISGLASSENLACRYHPSKTFADILKRTKSPSPGLTSASESLAANYKKCQTVTLPNTQNYFLKANTACESRCASAPASKGSVPALREEEADKCRTTCALVYSTSVTALSAYWDGRNDAAGQCGKPAEATEKPQAKTSAK